MRYRLWPDGTMQPADEEPTKWLSRDFVIVHCTDEDIDAVADHHRKTGEILSGTVQDLL